VRGYYVPVRRASEGRNSSLALRVGKAHSLSFGARPFDTAAGDGSYTSRVSSDSDVHIMRPPPLAPQTLSGGQLPS